MFQRSEKVSKKSREAPKAIMVIPRELYEHACPWESSAGLLCCTRLTTSHACYSQSNMICISH